MGSSNATPHAESLLSRSQQLVLFSARQVMRPPAAADIPHAPPISVLKMQAKSVR